MGFNDQFWLFVADLSPAVAEDSRFREALVKYNPGARPDEPFAYVGYTAESHPTVKYPSGDFSVSKVKALKKHGHSIRRDDFCIGNRKSKLTILRLVDRTIATLRGRGWTVSNEPPNRDHYVYAFQLDDEAAQTGKAQRLNPDPNPDMPCVYVGQSSLPPAERREEHLAGGRTSSAVVEAHYRYDLRGLYEHLNPLTERESLEKEQALARELRACGYTVLCG